MSFMELAAVLGNVGEFIGSIVVLITLVYLAVQVRHGKQLLETNKNIALGQISQANAEFRLGLQRHMVEPRVLSLREKVEQGDSIYRESIKKNFDLLSLEEKMLWRSVQAQFAIMHDDALYQATLGLIDDTSKSIWERGALHSMPYWEHFDSYVPTRLRLWYDKQDRE